MRGPTVIKMKKPKMSDCPIPTGKIIKSKKYKSRQQEKIDLKKGFYS